MIDALGWLSSVLLYGSLTILGLVVSLKVFGWLSDKGWLPGHEDYPSIARQRLPDERMEPSWLQERRARKPLEHMSVPDVFRTAHGKATHALKNYVAGQNGSEPFQSYCGIETSLDDVTGEGSVTCQRCLKSLKLESSKVLPARVEPKPRRTAWDRLTEDEDDASLQ